jgi:hypothetical protein
MEFYLCPTCHRTFDVFGCRRDAEKYHDPKKVVRVMHVPCLNCAGTPRTKEQEAKLRECTDTGYGVEPE